MRIEVAGLEGGQGTFAHAYAAGELVLADDRLQLVDPPQVSGEIGKTGHRVQVSGRVSGRVQVECDRCLKLIGLPVDSRFRLEYVTPEDYQAQQAIELTEDDLDLSIFDGEVIDIDELVAEELQLAVPDQVLCKDECQGLCPVCGIDRNSIDCECQAAAVDPRWAGLQELVNSK